MTDSASSSLTPKNDTENAADSGNTRAKARRRALRAAHVVSLALVLGGCSDDDVEMDASVEDSGLDASEEDAGELDAGEADAGEADAGGEDAGEADAGGEDAGEADAGEADAGEVDAGEMDAGEADASVSDGGEADSGSDDGGMMADAAACTEFPPTDQECCEMRGGAWDSENGRCIVAVPGPFVPPSMNA